MVVEELHVSISYAFLREGCKPVHTQQQEEAKIKELLFSLPRKSENSRGHESVTPGWVLCGKFFCCVLHRVRSSHKRLLVGTDLPEESQIRFEIRFEFIANSRLRFRTPLCLCLTFNGHHVSVCLRLRKWFKWVRSDTSRFRSGIHDFGSSNLTNAHNSHPTPE